MKDFEDMLALANYLKKQNTVDQFVNYADKRGLQRRNLLIRKSHTLLERYINSRIIYNMLDEQAWNQYINLDDPVVSTALRVFRNNASFPKPPVKTTGKKNAKVAITAVPYQHIRLAQPHVATTRV
jgi:carboxyl-terminal processing protease